MIYFDENKYNYLFQLQASFVYNAYKHTNREICIEGSSHDNRSMLYAVCCEVSESEEILPTIPLSEESDSVSFFCSSRSFSAKNS